MPRRPKLTINRTDRESVLYRFLFECYGHELLYGVDCGLTVEQSVRAALGGFEHLLCYSRPGGRRTGEFLQWLGFDPSPR